MSLTLVQKRLLALFYSKAAAKVVLDKKARKLIWDDFKNERGMTHYDFVQSLCPALHKELGKAIRTGKLVQSAVFSECVYSQTLANLLGLKIFKDSSDEDFSGNAFVDGILKNLKIVIRYVYSNSDGSTLLLQAGGAGGVDAALIFPASREVFRLEYKEPGAKSSEPDLPKYGEDGLLKSTAEFERNYPQFNLMIREQLASELNIFDTSGSNVNRFSEESVMQAASENYIGEHHVADAILTEDKHGVLTLFPSQDVGLWAQLKGQIRPAGRNAYKVWTPKLLKRVLKDSEAIVESGLVSISLSSLKTAKPRGGLGISRYKISPLFFVREKNVSLQGATCQFSFDDIEQLNPTISAHMFFKRLRYQDAKDHYLEKG